jgi:hypothetical protein
MISEMLAGEAAVPHKRVDYAKAGEEAVGHDCSQFTVQTVEGEMVCIQCGKVDDEALQEFLHEAGASDGAAHTASDHNAGNGLFNSQTTQAGYVSRKNTGVAFMLNDPRGKDAQGRKIKKQLLDPYKSGLVADNARGCHTEEDVMTGKIEVKFSRYDAPLIPFIKEHALKKCMAYRVDMIGQTLVSKEINRLYAHICLDSIPQYIALAALLNHRHLLPKAVVAELEREMVDCIEDIRSKVVSGCAKKIKK